MENQAIKRQKFEFGKSRQILRIKTQTSLPHKSKLGLTGSTSSLCPTAGKTRKEERKVYAREPAAPFVSMAETISKFHSSTREMSLPGVRSSCNNDSAPSMTQRKPKLSLTRPNEPDFKTSQRVRPVRIKSSAETEEEMMAKIPKFKARPVNKKILEAPSLAPPQRSTPCLPEFHEFHLKTMVRANQNADTSSSIVSKESTQQNQQCTPRLTAPISPVLQTSLRARPPKEKLVKAPKFKARPLNKKIFESQGEMGLFCNHPKPQITVPQEFHFAVDERIPPPAAVFDLFDKLSISAEPGKQIPMNTAPNPFHIRTENQQCTPRLTAPISPVLQTSLRAHPPKEKLVKAPKFKARPLNKKIFESQGEMGLFCNHPKPQITIPQEFHFAVDERIPPPAAVFNLFDKLSISAEPGKQIPMNTAPNPFHIRTENQQWTPRLTAPISHVLQTSLRARPPKEKLDKAPKFKARPLNKKIFESKGEMGLFCNHPKPQITIPPEFHFAVDERIPPSAAAFDLFDMLSISTEPGKQIPMNTAPNPFHLRTEERGAEKHKKFVTEVVQQLIEEERSRVPKATPMPLTTDYHVIPPKPEPKSCTKSDPFQLESVLRHEEEMQRKWEERQRKEKEEAEMRKFKAQPVLKQDRIPVPQKVRKPLTEIRGFNLQVEKRAVERSKFEKKLKEKEMMYKRYRDEVESEKMMEEDKALKRLRRSMVPHARAVPNFNNPFLPQKSCKDITKPKPPKLLAGKRTERWKAGTTSVAIQMR